MTRSNVVVIVGNAGGTLGSLLAGSLHHVAISQLVGRSFRGRSTNHLVIDDYYGISSAPSYYDIELANGSRRALARNDTATERFVPRGLEPVDDWSEHDRPLRSRRTPMSFAVARQSVWRSIGTTRRVDLNIHGPEYRRSWHVEDPWRKLERQMYPRSRRVFQARLVKNWQLLKARRARYVLRDQRNKLIANKGWRGLLLSVMIAMPAEFQQYADEFEI